MDIYICVQYWTHVYCPPLKMEAAGQEVEKGVGGLEMMLECWNWCNKWDAKKKKKKKKKKKRKEKRDGERDSCFSNPSTLYFPIARAEFVFYFSFKSIRLVKLDHQCYTRSRVKMWPLYMGVCLLRGACECRDVVQEFPCTFIAS